MRFVKPGHKPINYKRNSIMHIAFWKFFETEISNGNGTHALGYDEKHWDIEKILLVWNGIYWSFDEIELKLKPERRRFSSCARPQHLMWIVSRSLSPFGASQRS